MPGPGVCSLSLSGPGVDREMNDINIHYRLPLILITKYKWAMLNKPGKAILPVIGVFNNKEGETYVSLFGKSETIMKYAGYKKRNSIVSGLRSLINAGIITRTKQEKYKTYILKLSDIAKWKHGRSYFPIDKKEMILNYRWAKLNSIEKSLYPILGVKSTINAPDKPEDCYGIGIARPVEKYCKWAGINKPSFYKAFRGLVNKELITDSEFIEDDILDYTINAPGITINTTKSSTSYKLRLDYEDGELHGDVEKFIFDMEPRYDFDVNKEVENITNWLIKNRISRGKITDLPGFIIHCLDRHIDRHSESQYSKSYDKNNFGDQIANKFLKILEQKWEK